MDFGVGGRREDARQSDDARAATTSEAVVVVVVVVVVSWESRVEVLMRDRSGWDARERERHATATGAAGRYVGGGLYTSTGQGA